MICDILISNVDRQTRKGQKCRTAAGACVYFFVVVLNNLGLEFLNHTTSYHRMFRQKNSFRGRTQVRIKGQNLNFYLETHAATTHDIYFIRLRILPRDLAHYTGV